MDRKEAGEFEDIFEHRNKQHSIVQGAASSRAAVMTVKLALNTDTDPEKMCPGVRCWSALRSVPIPAPGTDTCYCHECHE